MVGQPQTTHCGIPLPPLGQKEEGKGDWSCGKSCGHSSLGPLPKSQPPAGRVRKKCMTASLSYVLMSRWGLSRAKQNCQSEGRAAQVMQSQEWAFLTAEQGREEQKTDLGAITGQNCFLGSTKKIRAESAPVIWNWFKIFKRNQLVRDHCLPSSSLDNVVTKWLWKT